MLLRLSVWQYNIHYNISWQEGPRLFGSTNKYIAPNNVGNGMELHKVMFISLTHYCSRRPIHSVWTNLFSGWLLAKFRRNPQYVYRVRFSLSLSLSLSISLSIYLSISLSLSLFHVWGNGTYVVKWNMVNRTTYITNLHTFQPYEIAVTEK